MTTTDSDTATSRDRGKSGAFMPARDFMTAVRELGIDPQDPRMLKLAEHQRFVEDHAPKVIPPCPAWCVQPAGHDYDGTDGSGEDLTFERTHVALDGERLAIDAILAIDAMEHNHHGTVATEVPLLYVNHEGNFDAEQARAFAAELLSAADLLATITGRAA